eukprot:TRINITY_DN3340_c0_g1_i1.p2 TRINITY_DN3340_c0_g1~~TRINITY_DN3340_c0_g1_i1.p2  ORF type:complete len:229 (-),score=128.73 TRINITY_DN3340_c0_g1_i1:157-771(-)
MSSYKLVYFNGKGRAELARLVFAAAGVQYEDQRITREELPEIKASGNLPFGQLPVLVVDGVYIAQSIAIARYIAKRNGLAGDNDLEAALCDMIVDGVNDLLADALKVMFAPADQKEAAAAKFTTEQLPKHLGNLQNILNKNATGYFVGSKLSWADIAVYNIIDYLNAQFGEHIKPFAALHALCDKVVAQEGIAKWIAVRPVTPF